MSASRTLAAGHSSEMGLHVPCDESLSGLGIGMTNEVFQIDRRRQDPSLEVVNRRPKLLAISLGEVWDLPVKVMPSFSAVCLDLPSIPLIVLHSLVLSVLWSMLSTNSLHCLLL